ncbi:MAG: hypothetical protein JRG73_02535 [Deltaproteobacteria bacterium]|nr:hypothetical protein [Deltaproteobacteria bacterium]MBW2305788.1 hypothetical protein [Deltaproteobacteria bacterium]
MERKVFIGMGVVLIVLILYAHNFTIRVSRHELEALSDQQRALVDRTRTIQNKRENIRGTVAALRSAIQDIQNQSQSLNLEVQTLEKDLKTLERGLEQSDRAVSRIKTTPAWNINSMDMALVLLVLLFILWTLYRWYMDHRRQTAGATGEKMELKVVEGRKEQSSASSAGMGRRKNS